MTFNEKMSDRIREMISPQHENIVEKKMFGGLCFMVNDKMCVCVEATRLKVRFDPAKT
jgi:TfoX/Sxy family transcriptional regulator of competence genes